MLDAKAAAKPRALYIRSTLEYLSVENKVCLDVCTKTSDHDMAFCVKAGHRVR